MTLYPLKLHILKNPLLSLLQKSKTTSQIHQIHAQLITTNLISDPFAASRLLTSVTSNIVNMLYAELVFNQIHQPNTFICNTMIKGYVQSSEPKGALHFYTEMRRKGLLVDNYTYPFVLKGCGIMMGLVEGKEVHGEVVKRGFGSDLFVANGLIGMYCRCGETGWGRMLFDGFCGKDLVSWNSMLGGYVGCGEMGEAQKLFDEMLEKDVVSWSIMIDGYGKIAEVGRARVLFDSMPMRDLVSWNSMLNGFAIACQNEMWFLGTL
ncbi:hypothetical protein L1049_025214 [Liquidambar formosana]|uniref:Pentatricopeptide repeat-containing protein n=1 Tax=Liquidambar formosana TaxID=63359 RepID=A0AAP0RW89_LIQFO